MELQTKANSVMSDEKIVDLYWQRDEQAIKETDIKYKRFLTLMNLIYQKRYMRLCILYLKMKKLLLFLTGLICFTTSVK